MDDIRNHDAMPTAEESEWMQVDGFDAALRACVLAVFALLVGLGVSMLLDEPEASAAVAIFGPR
jgi:hypothetical protein